MNYRKFDGRAETLLSWFNQAETMGKHSITNTQNAKATIQAALSDIDWDLPDNPAAWIAGDEFVAECKSWSDF